MRLRRLGLLRYGRFTDRVVDLPEMRVDFHLVVGPNEAGKSTMRNAISDLLFGIETRTPFDFLHAYGDMRLHAVVEDGERTIEFQRLKRTRQSLRDASDDPLPDDALAAILGGASRDFFERMFGLDHARLVAGGLAILEAKDDVGRVLFETSAGLTTLGPIRDELEREAKSLWDRRRAGDRAYYRAADALKAAEDDVKTATVRAKAWREIDKECEDAESALAAATKEHETLEATRARLERIRRVSPHIQRLHDARRELVRLGDIDTATDAQWLDRQAEIEALVAIYYKVKDYPDDIRKRHADVDTLARDAAAIAGQLGLAVSDPARINETIPSLLVRSEIAELLKSETAIAKALAFTSQAVDKKESDLDELSREIDSISDRGASPALRVALDTARDLGDTDRQKSESLRRLEDARRRFDAAIVRLTPWSGSIEQLRALAPPTEEYVRTVQHAETEIRNRVRAAEVALEDTAADIEYNDAAASRLRDDRKVVSTDDIVAARQTRQAAWRRIKGAPDDLASLAADYEATVMAADDLADRRYAGATDAGRLESAREATLAFEAKKRSQERLLGRARQELDSLTEEWSQSLTAVGTLRPTPAGMLEWLRHRSDALDAADALADAEKSLADLARRESDAVSALRSALADDGIALPSTDGLSLRGLAGFAAGIVTKADKEKARCDEIQARLGKERLALEKLREQADEERARHAEWARRWEHAVKTAGLPAETSPAVGPAALDLLTRLDGLLEKIQEIQRARIETMQRDLQSFSGKAAELATVLAPDLAGRSSDDTAIALSSRLREAVRTREHAERASQAIRDATSDVINAGDGLPLVRLEEEVASEDLSTIAARLRAIDIALREVVARREECSERKSKAESARDAVHGQDDAASAESRRQQALAEMADVTARFIKVFIAARLLRWSIDRYREEKQGPLLRRAGEIFATLTLGSFDKLTVDFDGDMPQLVARRPAGTSVGVTGMSEGTRDQLYLALRLAAVELHLAQGRALPFVADDLFINYDDERAAAGFKVLSELATRTQVIFLTHHDHLVPVARDAIAEDIGVVSL